MANKLTLDVPITFPPITNVKLNPADQVNSSGKEMVIEVVFRSDGDSPLEVRVRLPVSNARSATVALNPGPTDANNLFLLTEKTPAEDPRLTQAFDQVMGAYFQAGASNQDPDNAVLAKCAELGIIPPGGVS